MSLTINKQHNTSQETTNLQESLSSLKTVRTIVISLVALGAIAILKLLVDTHFGSTQLNFYAHQLAIPLLVGTVFIIGGFALMSNSKKEPAHMPIPESGSPVLKKEEALNPKFSSLMAKLTIERRQNEEAESTKTFNEDT